jgi:hypothetical protein
MTAPNATTLRKFPHLLDVNNLTERFFIAINTLQGQRDSLSKNAPLWLRGCSKRLRLKNRDVQRDPDIHKQQGALSGDRQERHAVLCEFRSGETDEHQA